MFRHPLRSLVRKVPLSAWAALGWTNRHTVGLWWRSIVAEARRDEPFSLQRWRTLFKALLKVTGDHRLANARALKQINVDGGEVTATTADHWEQRGVLRTVLQGVAPATDVRLAAPVEPVRTSA